MSSKQVVVVALMLGTFGGSASAQTGQRRPVPTRTPVRSEPALEWKTLLIIKPVTRIKMEGVPEVNATIAADNIAAVRRVFEQYTAELVQRMSNGRVVWKPEVVVSPYPLETVTNIGGDTYWVAARDVAKDYDRFVPVGKYDGVFVYWLGNNATTGAGVQGGFGFSLGPQPGHRWAGHSSVHHGPTDRWQPGDQQAEIFLHEGLHQYEAHYGELGVKLPRGGLHGAENYGINGQGPDGWQTWYQLFLTGDVREPDGSRTGLGEAAWRLGTIRQASSIHMPQFLTAERRAGNLLADPSFEQDGSAWTEDSWRRTTGFSRFVYGTTRHGQRALHVTIARTGPDDIGRLKQQVAVKQHTRYLLSGWVRVKDVTDSNPSVGAISGAHLGIWGGFEATQQLLGSSDWQYVSLEFNSRERTEVEVSCSLGHWDSNANGEAWFDDLVLIELPTVPASSLALTGTTPQSGTESRR